jgi:flagellar biosynthesis/type III secretory pathway chaperone
MGPDYKVLAAALKEECELMAAMTAALEREREALSKGDMEAMGEAAGAKETLVHRLTAARDRRKGACVGSTEKGLRSLAKAAPPAWGDQLRALQRRAADLAERVFLLNRGNGQVLTQGRDFLRQRMDVLRFRGGRVVLYGRRPGYVSIGGASIVQRDL